MLEVGDFVRVNGIIGKVEQIGNSLFWIENGSSYSLDDKSVNHSKNIIDLIEVGDIVHTRDVLNEDIVYIWSEEYLKALKEDLNNGIELVEILTHEQYMKNCYTVERKEEC